MSDTIKIVLDAMGGDDAPGINIEGAVSAMQEKKNISIVFTGKEEKIKEELSKFTYDSSRVEIVDAPEVIGFDEAPVMAVRTKKNSSIVVGMNLVKKGETFK